MAASMLRSIRFSALLALTMVHLTNQWAFALPRTWIGGNVNWNETAGVDPNWSPNFEPDSTDEAIFNTANTVNLGTANTIQALTMSGGIDLNTNDQDLTIDGLVQISNSGTNLHIGGTASAVQADSMTINASATLRMEGGTLQIIEETGNGLFTNSANGTVIGYGTINFTDALVVPTTVYTNDGVLTANHSPLLIFGDPPVDTLSITLSSGNARINLDGLGDAGVVNVNRNQTLDINGTLSDAYSSTITLLQNSKLDISTAWTLDTGTITADNGFQAGGIGFPDVAAAKSTISGGAFTQTGGTITVVDNDGVQQFDAPFTMNGGNLVNNGLVIFNANATIGAAANFTMPTLNSSITVDVARAVTINQTNFDVDGGGGPSTSIITVESAGLLTINTSDYDDDAVNRLDGIITLNSGDIVFTSTDAETVLDGTLNLNFTTLGQIPTWSGEPLDIGDDGATGGALDANVNVTGAGTSRIAAQVDFNSDADVSVATGAIFDMTGTVNFDTVNGANNAEFTGTGEISFSGQVNVNEAVTLNMVGGTVDLDGKDGIGDFVNIDAPLVINAATMSGFGKLNGGGGVNTLDIDNLNVGNAGTLTVNLDSASISWTLNADGVMNLLNDNTPATLLAGNDVTLRGTVNVTGDVRTTARVDIASTAAVNINTANEPLRLAGGNNSTDPNTIAGGTIGGVGLLAADTGKALHGFGTINAGIDFDGTANLKADNGTLTLNGALNDVNIFGTADADGVLNIPAAWNTSTGSGAGSIASVQLVGGTLQGGTITNDNSSGIQGIGTVTSRVINNTRLLAGNGGGTLVFQTAANDNDWDGAANTGQLSTRTGATLELRDNALFGFTGSVTALAGSTVFANGFALDFNPGSTIELTGATYKSTNSTDIGGTVTVNAGPDSTLDIQVNRFLTLESTSVTTLNGNLRLVSNNASIAAGATFSGPSALIVPANNHLILEPNANANVLLINDGTLRPNGFNTVGRVDVKDYQQDATGQLIAELAGTALNQFDRLVVNGNAVLNGMLSVELEGVFVPAFGNTFQILSATAGRSGTFSGYTLPSLGAVNSLAVVYSANNVTLQVIAGLWGDYNQNGVVDAADYVVWRNTLGTAAAAFSGADGSGNGIVDQADYDVWRSRFGAVLGPGVGSGVAVPEPTTLVLMILSVIGWCSSHGRAAKRVPSTR